MPVRRIREAGRPNIHWIRWRDSCGHNKQGGNSFSVRKGQSREGRQKKKWRKGERKKARGRDGGLGGVMVDPGEFQWRETWKPVMRGEETLKNKVLVGTGIFRHLVCKQRRRWGHQFLLHHQEELHRWWDFSEQRFKLQHRLHFKMNIYKAEMPSIASVLAGACD